jgi:predicted RNA methylase
MKSSARERHAHMVDDPRRTPALLEAISRAVRPGDVVLDIGTGLGVLAIAAAKAGAERVWAVDVDAVALEEARGDADREGVADRISFVQGLSFDLELDETASVCLCETVGSFAFDENILATLTDAKARLLDRDARMVPSRLELWGALIDSVPKAEGYEDIGNVKRPHLISAPTLISSTDFSKNFSDTMHAKPPFEITRDSDALALALWPRAIWWEGLISDASPMEPSTHWRQGLMPLEPKRANKGDVLTMEIIIGPHPEDPLTMTERMWRWI